MKSCTGDKAEGGTKQMNGKSMDAVWDMTGNSDLKHELTLSKIKSKCYILLTAGSVASVFSIPAGRIGDQPHVKSGEGDAARQVRWRFIQSHDSSSEMQ